MKININKYGSGYPLVFFHGWGFNSQIWMSLVPQLIGQYQLILVDLPGFGQSALMEWEQFLAQLLEQLPERFALIGWSMGGLFATRLAIEKPERVTHLINIASTPKFLANDNWPGASRELFLKIHEDLVQDPLSTLNEFIEFQVPKNIIPPRFEQLPSTDGLTFGLNIIDRWDLREQLHQLTQPVCYMFGRLDSIVPIRVMQLMQEIYPQFHYVYFKRAAHIPFLSHQEQFLDDIRGFVG